VLTVENLYVNYGAIKALKGVTLNVPHGAIVTIIGANGAGKTTMLRTISGIINPVGGRITFEHKDITKFPPHKIVELGICQVPEGRLILANL